ncbi:MAG: pyridoxamine 5'-phosphate oxidase family protein [Chitinophagales bacterium]|nr:pyridoxamine 5'-phosphate oxidase family protein [Chitinophagales bacterium]
MGKFYESITPKMKEWIEAQKMFFVATAPLAADGHVNCSPKGLDSFRVLDEHTVAYLDLTGSGVETIAHLRENGRLTIMFCAMNGAPKIVRLFGKGTVYELGTDQFEALKIHFPAHLGLGARSIIQLKVDKVGDSCGFAVPRYEYQEQRDTLIKWAENKGKEGVSSYQQEKNKYSIDGLPGMK